MQFRPPYGNRLGLLRHHTVVLFGLLSWVIPFAVSFAFFGPGGKLNVPQPLFKSLMVVIAGAAGAFLLVRTFRRVPPTFGNGLVIGLYWLVINLALDFLVLLPLNKMKPTDYLMEIGVRYLVMPVVAAAMGLVGEGERR